MALELLGNTYAVAPGISTSFKGVGGQEPYVYSIAEGHANGTIDPDTGVYTAPEASPTTTPGATFDLLLVTDGNAETAMARIMVGTPIFLLADIIRREMGLTQDQVWLWDQKFNIPTDEKLYVAIRFLSAKPFGNSNRFLGSEEDGEAVQSVNMNALMSIDIFSRSAIARDRKEEIILALQSDYAQRQQELNSFYVAKLSSGFVDLSQIDGPAIPYRFNITVNMQYFVKKRKSVPYFDTFEDVDVQTEP